MFEVGKKVICIKTHCDGDYKRGQVFNLICITTGCKHYPVLLDIGLKLKMGQVSTCNVCDHEASREIQWCSAKCFAPYDDSLSELTAEDILEETNLHTAEQA